MDEQKHITDHDLLITLNTRVQDLIETIRRMDGMTVKDIGGLQQGKVDKEIFATHEAVDRKEHKGFESQLEILFQKTDSQSKLLWIGVGAIAVLQFLVPLVIQLFFK